MKNFLPHTFLVFVALATIPGCGGKTNVGDTGAKEVAKGSQSGTAAEAKALLNDFIKPGADHPLLSKKLRPQQADYSAVLKPNLAKKAEGAYSQAWDSGQIVIAPKSGQTEVLIFSATVEELRQGKGGADKFPGGYQRVTQDFQDGLTLYAFKFVEPGKDIGMAFDGLVFVNGQWRIFPKPFRLAESGLPEPKLKLPKGKFPGK